MDLDAQLPADGCRPPSPETAIAAAEVALGVQLPDDLRAFFRHTDGFNGFLRSDERLYIRLHPVADVVALTRATDLVVEDFPTCVVVGDSGGSWLYVLDLGPEGPRYRELGLGEGEVTAELGPTFAAFLEAVVACRDGG